MTANRTQNTAIDHQLILELKIDASGQVTRKQSKLGRKDTLEGTVLAFCWYVAVSRLHLRNSQCLEMFMDFAVLFFGGGLVIAQLAGRRRKREENWPHPPLFVPSLTDGKIAREASKDAATLLGYNVHKEPWLWPDVVRMKHGVIVGGTGAGKSTFLENIIAQDLMRQIWKPKDADDHLRRQGRT